jgi:hypothetical protein
MSRAPVRLMAVALALAGAGVVHADDIPETYIGTYRYAGGQSQREALSREIDRVADQLGFFIRGIARGRMHNEIRPEQKISIARDGGEVTFQFDDRPPIVCDGGWHPAVGANDETGTGRCTFTRGQLRYNERYDDGRSNHALALSGDGRTLRMAVRISHPRLPDDVRYRLTYRRR